MTAQFAQAPCIYCQTPTGNRYAGFIVCEQCEQQNAMAAAHKKLASRVAELEAALRKLLSICEIAEFYMPGELAENADIVSSDIAAARRLLGGAS